MKKLMAILMFFSIIFALTACVENAAPESPADSPPSTAAPTQPPETKPPSTESTPEMLEPDEEADITNILVAYFSRTGENYNVGVVEKGNTAIVAEIIAEQTGGTLFEIQPVTPYPEGYEDTKVIATQEKNDNARPAIFGTVDDIDSYDIIFIGYPIWWGTNPMIVNTFLESYDLSGKTLIPFCTAAGSGFGSSVSDIEVLCPDVEFLEGFTVPGADAQNSQSDVESSVIDWLDRIAIAHE